MRKSANKQESVPLDLLEAAGTLLPGHREAMTVAGAPHVIRVETISGPARVTRWPLGTTLERIATLHQTLGLLRRADLHFIPMPISGPNGEQSTLLPNEQRYDARGWVGGLSAGSDAPIATLPLPGPISIDHIAEAARAIGYLHHAGAPVIHRRLLPLEPLTALHRAASATARDVRRDLVPVAQNYPPARGWMNSLDRVISATADTIGTLQEGEERRLVVAHGDLWPEHLLFTRRDGRPVLTGLVGWGRVAASSPLLDLGQLIARTVGWTQDIAEAVVSAYGDVADLTPVERRALPGIAGLDLMGTSAMLLHRYLLPPEGAEPAYGETQRLLAAIELSLKSLDNLLPVISGFDSPTPKRGRKWVYRTQAPGPRSKKRDE